MNQEFPSTPPTGQSEASGTRREQAAAKSSPPPTTVPGNTAPFSVLALGVASLALILMITFGGPAALGFSLLAFTDAVSGARFSPEFPPLAWALWGLLGGAALGFWLDAPLYGLRNWRTPLLLGGCLLLPATFIYGLMASPAPQRTATPVPPPPPPPPEPPAPNFAGTWDTGRWGTMTLQQAADGRVWGFYTYSDGLVEGTANPFQGSPARFTFRWRNRNGGSAGVGYFDLRPGADSFSGGWAVGETLQGDGREWNGVRTAAPPPPPPPPSFTGTWSSDWGSMEIHQGVKVVNGTYEYGSGIVNGTIDESRFTFHWTNRLTEERGTGYFDLSQDGLSFSGRWRAAGDSSSAKPWAGKLLTKD